MQAACHNLSSRLGFHAQREMRSSTQALDSSSQWPPLTSYCLPEEEYGIMDSTSAPV